LLRTGTFEEVQSRRFGIVCKWNLLPIFYAGVYFLAAFAGYLFCTQLVPRWRGIAGIFFVGILAFGACSYLGFIGVVMAVGVSPLRSLLQGTSQPITYIAAYVLPGLFGVWLSIKALRSGSDREIP
jgi:hypothetical protein